MMEMGDLLIMGGGISAFVTAVIIAHWFTQIHSLNMPKRPRLRLIKKEN